MTLTPQYPVQAVDNALQVLLLLRDRPVVRLSEVAVELGVARSTAHRLLATLLHRGFVAQDRESRAYRAGGVLVEIAVGALGALDLRALAAPHMHRLRQDVSETVHLMALEGRTVRFIDGVEGPRVLRVGSRIGVRVPAYSTSGGKALLACLDPRAVEAMYPPRLRQLTDDTITTRSELLADLERVRARGYATNVGESEARVAAVGAAVRGPTGHPLVAVVAAAPAERLSGDALADVGARVARAADDIADDVLHGSVRSG
jgi:DNA-binding IclR family transcriptional regulator